MYSRCNLCRLAQLRIAVRDRGQETTLVKDAETEGAVYVYAHPPGVDVASIPEEERERYFAAWYMAVPHHCAC